MRFNRKPETVDAVIVTPDAANVDAVIVELEPLLRKDTTRTVYGGPTVYTTYRTGDGWRHLDSIHFIFPAVNGDRDDSYLIDVSKHSKAVILFPSSTDHVGDPRTYGVRIVNAEDFLYEYEQAADPDDAPIGKPAR
ncbi:MAG: hypothetical protein AB7R77_12755 [Ilumatobacteraceae bacterium]